jgi:hypothetical protein
LRLDREMWNGRIDGYLGRRRRTMGADFDREWWEAKWTEQEDALFSAFGPSHPVDSAEGYVTSFNFADVPLPGACVYTFRPNEGSAAGDRESRKQWLYMTHGLSQWPSASAMAEARSRGNRLAGGGVEYALVFDEASDWAPGLLRWVMKYVHGQRPINAGDRVPFQFESLEPGDVRWAIGVSDAGDPCAADDTQALVFWRYLSPFGSFTSPFGEFEMRVATTITAPEWELAKATSSCHLLLLLEWAGIGQRSVPGRPSVTERPGWEEEWTMLGTLPFAEAKNRLQKLWRRNVK